MNVDLSDGPIYVTLSRRNLEELLVELDMKTAGDPTCTIAALHRVTPSGLLTVEAQENDVHYGERVPGRRGMVNP